MADRVAPIPLAASWKRILAAVNNLIETNLMHLVIIITGLILSLLSVGRFLLLGWLQKRRRQPAYAKTASRCNRNKCGNGPLKPRIQGRHGCILAILPLVVINGRSQSLETAKPGLWVDGPGSGFDSSAQTVTAEVGVVEGIRMFGGRRAHNLAMGSVSYGHMLGGEVGRGRWYAGNFEGRMELLGGGQYHPEVDARGWVVGLTPHLRYDFATGTRWVPFADLGAGVTATGIGHPDLGGTFEFNLQAGGGTHYFLTDKLALTAEAHYLHMSCAGIDRPNLGLNGAMIMGGMTWLF